MFKLSPLLLLLWVSPAFASHGCPQSGVVKRTSEAVVVKRASSSGYPRYYACAYRYGNTFRLNSAGDFGTNMVIRKSIGLSGHFVAYQQDWLSGAGEANNTLSVKSLKSGKMLH